ncbi:MAG: CRISPR-associated ring nuclease, partial [Anaerolineae bacterium]
MESPKPTTLICTPGGQPQVVTFALDALLTRGVPVSELIVLHFSPPDGRLQQSLHKLTAEFAHHRYRERPLPLRLHPLQAPNQVIRDIVDESDANAAWEVINRLIIDLKNERYTLHISISGGRRILGLMTMSAAMLHFGHQDVLWHMYTPDALRRAANEGAIMHVPPAAGFRLIRVPMMPWGSYFPALRQLVRP